MSYTKQTNIPCADGETVVQLDSGDYIAVSCPAARNTQTNFSAFAPLARWIDANGASKQDGAGHAVITTQTISLAPDDVTRLTPDAVVKECLLLVLGEALTPDPNHAGLTIIPWSAAIVAQCSVRNAIAAGSLSAPSAASVL